MITHFIYAIFPRKGKALTYCSSEIFTLANVREFQDFLPLFAFAFAFPSTPCRERNIRIRLLWGLCPAQSLPAQSQFLWLSLIIKAEILWVDVQITSELVWAERDQRGGIPQETNLLKVGSSGLWPTRSSSGASTKLTSIISAPPDSHFMRVK